MPNSISLNNLSNKCIEIIKNNDPEKSIDLISKIEYSKNNKIGINDALKIYKTYGGESVNYDSNKKISTYTKNVNKNKSKAESYVNSNKK